MSHFSIGYSGEESNNHMIDMLVQHTVTRRRSKALSPVKVYIYALKPMAAQLVSALNK